MAETSITIGSRSYAMHCRDGEEQHLARLAAMVDEKASAARSASPGLTEVRQLLFAAILLADELHDERGKPAGAAPVNPAASPAPVRDPAAEDALSARIGALAQRLEQLAARLEQ